MLHRYRRWIELIAIVAFVVLIDQISKQAILTGMRFGQTIQPIPAISQFFQFTLVENRGAAFGFLPQASDFFLVIALVVVVGMFIFYPRIPNEQVLARVALAMVCGGAVGNAVDRLQHGYVVDFIHYQIPGVISNVSNLADHAIVIGVIILIIDTWRMDIKSAKKPQGEAPETAETAETAE